MAKSESGKRMMTLLYGIGASIVILGALFKIMHWHGGNFMLIAGLITEAVIFFVSAFDTPPKEIDWTIVYPELAGGDSEYEYEYTDSYSEQKDPVSNKIDELFDAANIDSKLLTNLADSMKGLSKAAKGISLGIDASNYTKEYSEELGLATERVRSLNEFYRTQLEATDIQTNINGQIINVSEKIKDQMEDLSSNLSSLNTVYGDMLSAMKK